MGTAGAPVSPQLLARVTKIFPTARLSTPYGMTEVLPVTAASVDEIQASGSDAGVCVGRPLTGIDITIRPFDTESGSLGEVLGPDVLGEVCIRAAHGCLGYDGLWARQQHAFVDGWHRSGDVGHIDDDGRLWIEGRVSHLIHTVDGVLAPVCLLYTSDAADE